MAWSIPAMPTAIWGEEVLVKGANRGLTSSANGIIGATTHTPFAVTTRATFGYWGSKFVVFVGKGHDHH